MNIKKNIINQVKIYDFICRIHHFIDNRNYNKLLLDIESIDSILDYERFKQVIQPVFSQKKPIFLYRYSQPSYFYGYYDSLINYSGVDKKEFVFPVFSNMEHGMANIDSNRDFFSPDSLCYCSHSDYRRKEIHQIAPKRMYFSIGPYIHYAEKYYDEEKERNFKKSLGKTLLVFPFHKCENELNGKGSENVLMDIVYSKYAKKFDTILVCAYWFDVNDAIFDKYKERGAHIVSAGFRGDSHFIRRLKTIISLCDAAIMDEVGTNLGFCYYMGKTVYLEKRECRFNDDLLKTNTAKFIKSFYTDNFKFSEEQIKLQKELYNYYWGGDCIKSVDEIKEILMCAKEVLKLAGYSIEKDKVDRATLKYLYFLKESTLSDSSLRYQILKNSLN